MSNIYRICIFVCVLCYCFGIIIPHLDDVNALKIKSPFDNEFVGDIDNHEKFKATGFFYVEKEDGIWWLINPDGEKIYSNGIAFVQPGDFYYGDISDWSKKTQHRLSDWGFNTLNDGNIDNIRLFPEMYYVYKLSFKQISLEDGWSHCRIPDVFDLEWQNKVRILIQETADILRNDSNLIGYQTDNEMKWGPDSLDYDTLLEVYMAANKTTAGKKKVVEFFKIRYDNDTQYFNTEWNMDIEDFDDLYNFSDLGYTGWKLRSCRAKDDVDDFSRLVANTYFNFTNSILKLEDPNHLNFGVRFFFMGIPRPVLEECGKFVDVISINYYRLNRITYDPIIYFYSKLFDLVSLDNWMYDYYNITGKPLFSSEYTFSGRYSIWPIFPDDEMTKRGIFASSKHAYTQKGRADLFEWYSKNCLNSPYIVGHTWFKYQDRLNVLNFGLINIWDEPYLPLVNRMAAINNNAIKLHENASIISDMVDSDMIKYDISIPVDLDLIKDNPKGHKNYDKSLNYLDNKFLQNSNLFDKKFIENKNYNNTLYVGGSGSDNYSYIQDALDNASSGDRVYVYNGIYNESIYINKSISLFGQDKNDTIIYSNFNVRFVDYFDDFIVKISADNVIFSGFTITTSGGYFHDFFLRTWSGISIGNCDKVIISDNILKNLGTYGVFARQSSGIKIYDNIIYNILNKKGSNIVIDSSKESDVCNNLLFNSTICCIWLSRSSDISIDSNIISDSYYCGIILERVNNTKICNNIIMDNLYTGLLLRSSDDNLIVSNNFSKETNFRHVFFLNSYNNVWRGNYWGYNRILPKVIFGKKGVNCLIPAFNFDWNPL